jgi:hypothetical protein
VAVAAKIQQQLQQIIAQKKVAQDKQDNNNIGKYELYKACKTEDPIDRMLEQYLTKMQIRIPMERISSGYYHCFDRKIKLQIISGTLGVRVGGGFITFEKWVIQYIRSKMNILPEVKTERVLQPEARSFPSSPVEIRPPPTI